jgi:hypothetical protein
MKDEISTKLEQVLNEHKLIGNHEFSTDEYSQMIEIVGKFSADIIRVGSIDSATLSTDKDHNTVKSIQNLIFTTLVEIAKRWRETENEDDNEENSGFWCYVFKVLTGNDEHNHSLYSAFTSVIQQMSSRDNLPIVKTGKKYYSTLMMHAFSPKKSIHSFFDLCYNVFKKDLEFGFTSEDEWLCGIVAQQIASVLGSGYREDKKVSIGSSAYSIKIGLRSFALNEDLKPNFIKFITETFYQINQLFNREKIEENTRLKRYIVEWWKNKTETEKIKGNTTTKRRIPTVSKQNIVAKYIREDDEVFLCIPSIRLDDENSKMHLTIFVNGESVLSEEMRTKRGELVFATKQIEKNLNDLLKWQETINVKVEIKENGTVIFDSERNSTTLLHREFILFDNEKEVLSQINKPTNYFVYSKDIDKLKAIPQEIQTCSTNSFLHNIYPTAGESLIGETRQVFFVNKEKAARLGNTVCLIGNLPDVEWLLDEYTCVVYGNSVKLMIPETLNLKALELRIDHKTYKLDTLKYEQTENKCYQFGLKNLRLIAEDYPTAVSVFSYEKEAILLSETIISLPSLNVNFNHSVYYGEKERLLTVTNDTDTYKAIWSNQDSEVKVPLKDGTLLVKIPYIKWRIADREWHNESINRKLWYKEILQNGDLLEIENPKEDEQIKAYCRIDGQKIEIQKNQSGQFELGRVIYANENKTDIFVYFIYESIKYDIFTVATKEHFIENPLIYSNGNVFWNIENAFVGGKDNEFFLIAKANGKNEKSGRKKVGSTNVEFGNFDDNIYEIIVKLKDKNIFSKEETYTQILEDKLIVGRPEKFRFKNKRIYLTRGNCYHYSQERNFWTDFIPKYFIDNLQFTEENETIYYCGKLGVINQNGEPQYLNTMENEKQKYDKINPVRVELRDSSSLWMVAGYEGENDFIGNLFCDIRRKGICNVAKEDINYSEITLYKFKEEEYV